MSSLANQSESPQATGPTLSLDIKAVSYVVNLKKWQILGDPGKLMCQTFILHSKIHDSQTWDRYRVQENKLQSK